ncbi:hypothetical protein SO802_019595 [Lithocarpus litseifolius]|uniref:NAC domain-containing protein n=1 Tax=Lithocarpus litseifolius TaxID=425828 RepID=A0AAW2CRE9_9ROSI
MESNHNHQQNKPIMMANHNQQNNKPSPMAPGITNQVMISNIDPATQSLQALNVPRSNTISTYSSPPSVIIDPPEPDLDDEEEQEEEPNQQSEEVDELGLERILNKLLLEFDEEPEKQYHSFDNEDPPPGYKFSPTDFELIISYLVKKYLNIPLPWNSMVDVELYNHSPEWLAEEYKKYDEQEELYFFTPRYRKYPNGKRPDRAAGDGYWKATGADKEIESNKGITVGYKKTLVYYRGKPPRGDKTNWIMYEYKIKHPPLTRSSENDMRLDKWVLCKIYEKNESKSSSKANTRKACSKSSRANDRDEPMTNTDPTPMKRHINQSFHQNAHVHAFANQIQAMASNNGTLHPAHMGASRFPFDQSRAMAGNYGTPPAHMASMLPDQSQAMTRRFSNQSQVMAINHGTAPLSPMSNMFPSQSQVMTSNHGTPPPAHMASSFPNQPQAMTSNYGTPPAHMASRFPNQPRAMAFNHGASNFHNHFQPMTSNHGTPPPAHMVSRFPNQPRAMTSNHGTPPAHMASRFSNQPRAMAFNHGASNFHNHFQPMASNHETPQAFEPFYFRNPSMHSSESSAIVVKSETSIQKGDELSSYMPSLRHSNFSTTESSGYMPSTSAFSTNERSDPSNDTNGYLQSIPNALSGHQKDDTSNPRGYNNYQMDDEIPNKHQMPSDDHNPCK